MKNTLNMQDFAVSYPVTDESKEIYEIDGVKLTLEKIKDLLQESVSFQLLKIMENSKWINLHPENLF